MRFSSLVICACTAGFTDSLFFEMVSHIANFSYASQLIARISNSLTLDMGTATVNPCLSNSPATKYSPAFPVLILLLLGMAYSPCFFLKTAIFSIWFVWGNMCTGYKNSTFQPWEVRYRKSRACVSGFQEIYTSFSGERRHTEDRNASSLPARGGSIMTTSTFSPDSAISTMNSPASAQ